MKKSRLGIRIQALRKQKGVTQEELGKAVNVTAQAVSNWECGGSPDAELLPQIAAFFGVSIDHLFGRVDELKKNLGLEIMWDLYDTEKAKRFEKANEYCLNILQGLSDVEPNILLSLMKEKVAIPDSSKTFSLVCFDEGVALTRMNKETPHFFLMPTPKEGMRSAILEPEMYEKFFSLLGKHNRMKVFIFLYTRKKCAISISKIAKLLNMPEKEIVEIMQDLLELQLIYSVDTDTDSGEEVLYSPITYFGNSTPIIPFLISTTDMIQQPVALFGNVSLTRDSLL